MRVRASFDPSALPSQSPYRLLHDEGYEVDWANEFLDAQRLRGLSLRSLRAYAYDLLNLARWLAVASIELSGLTEGKLTDYIHYQLEHQVQPAPLTINHRLTVAICLYRFIMGVISLRKAVLTALPSVYPRPSAMHGAAGFCEDSG